MHLILFWPAWLSVLLTASLVATAPLISAAVAITVFAAFISILSLTGEPIARSERLKEKSKVKRILLVSHTAE